jgi:hypothetical protein
MVKLRWVFMIKNKLDGIQKWYKTMLIRIKGYTQVHGFDYNETFNLIIKHV